MASLSGTFEPRQPLSLRTVSREKQSGALNGNSKGEASAAGGGNVNGNDKVDGDVVILDHPFLLLRQTAIAVEDRPFSLEKSADLPASEVLDLIELELNGRDAEVQELKAMAFSRERAEGVAA